jgi:hypothetical protein
LVVDALEPPALAAFWSHATGLPMTREHPEYATVRRESGFWLEFVRVSEPKALPNRVRLQLAAPENGDVSPDATLVDPEGNEFSVIAR